MAATQVTSDVIKDATITGAKIADGTITAAKLAAGVLDGGGGAISWQSSVKTSSFTGTAGEGYFVDTTSSSVTVTLPSSPSVGDLISFVDYGGNSAVNPIVFTTSDNIEGGSADQGIQYNKGAVQLVFSGATKGWISVSASGEGSEALPTPITSVDAHFLVLAGGGGTGVDYYNGGGGAGGLRTSTGSTYSGGGSNLESAITLNLDTPYTFTVGAGGSGRTGFFQNASNGTDTTFASITSNGGAGGSHNQGNSGGCGAGGGSSSSGGSGGIPGGTGTAGQGFGGGASATPYGSMAPGGGGGTQSAGGNGNGQAGGVGGAGTNNNITGSFSYYGSGGGGARGGGSGSSYGANGTGWSTTRDQTGHGGGNGAIAGGSGVIILKWPSTFTATFSSGAVQNTTQISWNGALHYVSLIQGGSSDTVSFAYTG